MRVDQVPQDDSILEGHRRACYAQDAQGRYVIATSRGWEVERVANRQALVQIDARIAQALAQVRAGTRSPLEYHMARAHLEPRSLAQHAGLWTWQVRRHLRPEVFRALPPRTLQRYAHALAIDVEALCNVPPDAPATAPMNAPIIAPIIAPIDAPPA